MIPPGMSRKKSWKTISDDLVFVFSRKFLICAVQGVILFLELSKICITTFVFLLNFVFFENFCIPEGFFMQQQARITIFGICKRGILEKIFAVWFLENVLGPAFFKKIEKKNENYMAQKLK